MKTLIILLTMFIAFNCSNNLPLKQQPGPDMGKIEEDGTIIHYLTGIEIADSVNMSLSCDIVDREIGNITLTIKFEEPIIGQDWFSFESLQPSRHHHILRSPVEQLSDKEFFTQLEYDFPEFGKLLDYDHFTIEFQDQFANVEQPIGEVELNDMRLIREFAYRVEQDAL